MAVKCPLGEIISRQIPQIPVSDGCSEMPIPPPYVGLKPMYEAAIPFNASILYIRAPESVKIGDINELGGEGTCE